MKNFEELEKVISTHKDWQELLKKEPYNLKTIKPFVEHPNWFILSYNLIESDFKNPIVCQCRGTVVEVFDNGAARVICGPYTKFFNWDDPNSALKKIDWNTARSYAKIDGQLIKMFKYDGDHRDHWVTNGAPGLYTPLDYEDGDIKTYPDLLRVALDADLPKPANYLITENDFSCDADWVKKVPDGWTLDFELTSPQNRIVVKYDKTKLWLHGARDAEGNEFLPEDVAEMFGIPYEIPKIYDGIDGIDAAFTEYLNDMNGAENEGLVICDGNFNRIKVKCDSYLNMKFIRDTSESPEGIWRIVISEQSDDILSKAPELKEKIDDAVNVWKKFTKELKSNIAYAIEVYELDKNRNRKDFALWVNEQVTNSCWKPIFFTSIDKGAVETYQKVVNDLIENKNGYEKYLTLLKPLSEK